MASECKRVYDRLDTAKSSGSLDLANCKLTQIPNAVFMILKASQLEVPSICYCDLSFNFLKRLPMKLFTEQVFLGLKSLNLKSNKVNQLPIEIVNLKELEEINLAANQFEFLPEILLDLPSLKSVDISNNLISAVDVNRIENTVQQLDLSGNPLSDDIRSSLGQLALEKGIQLNI